jgi:uncharacterized membrane protein
MTKYNYYQPTSVQPSWQINQSADPDTTPPSIALRDNGWRSNDLQVFKVNLQPNEQSRKKTVRWAGKLQLWCVQNGVLRKVEDADKLYLNPEAGISGFIRQLTISFGGRVVELINEYGRLTSLKNSFECYQLDNCTRSDSLTELMTFSNDAWANGSLPDAKMKAYTGSLTPTQVGSSEYPFSIDLDCCLNSADIPYARTGEIGIEILLQNANQCGILVKGDQTNKRFFYTMTDCEVRLLSDVAKPSKEPIELSVKSSSAIPTIINIFSGLEFAPATSFHSIFAGFLAKSHDSTATNFNYDYLACEALPKIDFLEVKVNGQDDYLKYPLRFQTQEILYNALLSYGEGEVNAHALSYAKLGNNLKTGYSVGCWFGEELPANTRIAFNIKLQEQPSTSYRTFFYSLGKMIL